MNPKTKRICLNCQKTFTVAPSKPNQVYCSLACRKADKQVTLICAVCGNPYNTYKNYADRSKCCSRTCQAKYTGTINTEKSLVTRICPICDKPYQVRKGSKLKTCSPTCGAIAQQHAAQICDPQSKQVRDCANCHKPFEAWASRPTIYCSRACANKAKAVGEKITLICETCKHPYEILISFYNLRGSRFCSKHCQGSAKAEAMRGAKNPQYIDGQSGARSKWWYTSDWLKVKRHIKKRDDYTCQCCHTMQTKVNRLEVHHIIPFRLFIDKAQANNPTNLITLCKKCHKEIEYETKALLVNYVGCPFLTTRDTILAAFVGRSNPIRVPFVLEFNDPPPTLTI